MTVEISGASDDLIESEGAPGLRRRHRRLWMAEQIDFADFKPGDMIEFLWVDARYYSGWHDRDEIVSWERDFDQYRAAGFFVMATDRNVVFAEMWTNPGWDMKKCGGINSIPLSAIREWWRLERCQPKEER